MCTWCTPFYDPCYPPEPTHTKPPAVQPGPLIRSEQHCPRHLGNLGLVLAQDDGQVGQATRAIRHEPQLGTADRVLARVHTHQSPYLLRHLKGVKWHRGAVVAILGKLGIVRVLTLAETAATKVWVQTFGRTKTNSGATHMITNLKPLNNCFHLHTSRLSTGAPSYRPYPRGPTTLGKSPWTYTTGSSTWPYTHKHNNGSECAHYRLPTNSLAYPHLQPILDDQTSKGDYLPPMLEGHGPRLIH